MRNDRENHVVESPLKEASLKRKALMAIVVVLFCVALNFLIAWRNSPPLTPKIPAPPPHANALR